VLRAAENMEQGDIWQDVEQWKTEGCTLPVEPEWIFVETYQDIYEIYRFGDTNIHAVDEYAFYVDTGLADLKRQIDSLTPIRWPWQTVLEWCPGLEGKYYSRVVDSGGAIGPAGAEYTYLCPPVEPLGEAEIYLDGDFKGVTVNKTISLSGLSVGMHRICGRAPGFKESCVNIDVGVQSSAVIKMIRV
ncbi:hypothetical protein LCGC14_3160840, partial [marine sediment metagenome]